MDKDALTLKIRKFTENDVKFLNKVASAKSTFHYIIALLWVGLEWPLRKELKGEGVYIPRLESFETWLLDVQKLRDPGAFLLELCLKILAANVEQCIEYGLENFLCSE
jgi:hypothetical protein